MAELDTDALTVAMALVPDLYARNRLFSLYEDAAVRHARSRARLVRSILRHASAGRATPPVCVESEAGVVVTYEVPALRVSRRVSLTHLERSVLAVLAERADLAWPRPTLEDRAAVDAALARLPERRAAS